MPRTDMPRYSLEKTLLHVCARPQMFVGSRDFVAAAIFIHGFAIGRGGTEHDDIENFRDWLATECYQRFQFHRNWGWYVYVKAIFADDNDALKALPNLWFLYKQGATLKNVRKSSLLKTVPASSFE